MNRARVLSPLWLAAALAATAAAPASAGVQDGDGRQHLLKGRELAMAGDTMRAVAEFERAIRAAPNLADAHYEIGRLYTHRANAVETDYRDREKAEDALMRALQLAPRNPYYLMELGRLRLKQHMRPDAERLFNRALDEARKQDDPLVIADIHFNLGRIEEQRYEGMRNRRMDSPLRGPPVTDLGQLMDQLPERYLNSYLSDHAEISDHGAHTAELMVEHYRAALRHHPGHLHAAVRLMGYLLDRDRLGEYLSIARRLVGMHGDRSEPYLYLGLGFHAAGQEEDAAGAFEQAMTRLTDEERKAIRNLEPVLRREAALEYRGMNPEERARFDSTYWELRDPLYLTKVNEGRLEHFSRVAYADLRFAAPESGARGWETDRGVIYIRYGAPRAVGVFRANPSHRGDPFSIGRRTIVWSYGKEGPVFMFHQMPGYVDARFAGDYEFMAEQYRYVQPSAYDRIPSITETLELPFQVARFRGEGPEDVAVEIHAGLPLDSLVRDLDLATGEMQIGMFILNSRGDRVIERVGAERATYRDPESVDRLRSWRILMPPGGPLVAAVEAREELSWRSAVGRDTFTAEPFPAESLSVSDVLIADHLRPLREEPRSRRDVDLLPNPALTFAPGDPVHIYYELYGLDTDEDGYASFDVAISVRVKRLTRGGVLSEFLGGIADAWGFSIVGDDRLELRYNRQVRLEGRDRVPEFLKLDLRNTPAGEYEIRIRVWDRHGEHLASRFRTFQVVDSNSE